MTENPNIDFDLEEVASLFHGVAPAIETILNNDFVEKAHELNLNVIAWTILDD